MSVMERLSHPLALRQNVRVSANAGKGKLTGAGPVLTFQKSLPQRLFLTRDIVFVVPPSG